MSISEVRARAKLEKMEFGRKIIINDEEFRINSVSRNRMRFDVEANDGKIIEFAWDGLKFKQV